MALKARRDNLVMELLRRADAHHPTPDGYQIRFPAGDDILDLIARAVDAERQCCRFLRFSITVEPDGGPIAVDLSGPPGTREFLMALLEL
jgi:hypothetical protein